MKLTYDVDNEIKVINYKYNNKDIDIEDKNNKNTNTNDSSYNKVKKEANYYVDKHKNLNNKYRASRIKTLIFTLVVLLYSSYVTLALFKDEKDIVIEHVRQIDIIDKQIDKVKDCEKKINTWISTNASNKDNVDSRKQENNTKKSSFKNITSIMKSELLRLLELAFNKDNTSYKKKDIVIYKSRIKQALYMNDSASINDVKTLKEDVVRVLSSNDNQIEKNKVLNAFFNFESEVSEGKDILDFKNILESSNEKVDLKRPKVLIFHTHASEMYEGENPEGKNKNELGVIRCGTKLASILKEKYGFDVIHYTGVHDMVDGRLKRDGSYERIETAVREIISENPDISLAIDLHRDGVSDTVHLVTDINGKRCAKIMFVNGLSMKKTDGVLKTLENLKNENLYKNLNFSMHLELVADMLYPSLSRKILIKPYRYSLHMLANSALVEVGAQNNTIDEALSSMPYLAEIIAKSVMLKNETI